MARLLLLCCLPLLSSAIIPKPPPGLDTTKYQVDGTDERVWGCCGRTVTEECTATVKKNLKKDLCNFFSDRPIEKEVCHERQECGSLVNVAHEMCGKCQKWSDGSEVAFCAKDGSSTAIVSYSDSECQKPKKSEDKEGCDGYCDVIYIPFAKGSRAKGDDYGTCFSSPLGPHFDGHCDALCCHEEGRGHQEIWSPVESEAACNKSANCGYKKATATVTVEQYFLRMAAGKQDVVV